MSLTLNIDATRQQVLANYAVQNDMTPEQAALHFLNIGLEKTMKKEKSTEIPQDLLSLMGIISQPSQAELDSDPRLAYIMNR